MEPYGGMTFEEFWKLPAEVCEAVNRQVPLKPFVNKIHYGGLYEDLTVVQCAHCHRRLRTVNTRDKYCPSCGQKVKWEE